MYRIFFKRGFDLVISGCILFVLIPFIVLFAILIKCDSQGPVFYLQTRVGKDSKLFRIYKLRTMTDQLRNSNEKQTFLGDPDITRVGYFLRRFKIDELPQIVNVFIGNMSLVGPRPALPELYKEYGNLAKARLVVCPGMTGLAQVNGNIHLSWNERLVLDREYVENVCLWTDLCILLKTIGIILLGELKFVKK